MRRWWVFAALLLSVGLNCGLLGAWLARRGEPAGGRPPFAEPPVAVPPVAVPPRAAFVEMAERLHLTPEQRELFFERQRRFFESTQADRRAMEEARRELRREVARPAPDRARLDALLEEAGRRNVELERAFVEHVLATRELLSPEQQVQYLVMLGRLRPQRDVGTAPPGGRALRDRWLRRQPGVRPEGGEPQPPPADRLRP
jgi:uncharacterized membrane protein